MANKIYTRSGDRGQTSLFNGDRRNKDDPIFDALGNLDEFSAQIGVLCSSIDDDDEENARQILLDIMSRLLDIGSLIATPISTTTNKSKLKRTSIDLSQEIINLEQLIDLYTNQCTPLKNFILPTGTFSSAQSHVVRAVCRRTERSIVNLSLLNESDIPKDVLIYINRLSDFFFSFARYLNFKKQNEKNKKNNLQLEIIYKKKKEQV